MLTVGFEEKRRFVARRAEETRARRLESRLSLEVVERAKEERLARAEAPSKDFNLVFSRGRRVDNLDRAASEARVKAQHSLTTTPREESWPGSSLWPPFRVPQVRCVTSFDLKQRDARVLAEFARSVTRAPEEPAVQTDRRPQFCSRPARKAPLGDVKALEARDAAEARAELGEDAVTRGPTDADDEDGPPRWIVHYDKGPTRFDLDCRAAKAEKDQERAVAEDEHRRRAAIFGVV
mmetsp:Transcript_190/g.546  ORF Transcript_190/g.546 Transcript_190/m.546 type:complete len:236 (-) Transcript_190:155-862(-)